MIHKGDLVEFTDEYQRHYTIGDPELARYGIALEEEANLPANATTIRVRTAKGEESIPTLNVHASGWAGWIPPGLEDIFDITFQNLFGYDDDWGYDDYGF